MQFDNPWWVSGSIPGDYDKMKRRLYLDLFFPLVTDISLRRGVILMGPRRVGKTVMLFHTIEELLKQGVSPQKIIYLSIDTPIYNNISLEELFQLARESLKQSDAPLEGYYVFYDEIQYLKEWEVHLKSLIDSYRGVKFIASGSAAAALRMKSVESGAGRFTDFMLPPLTFNEYIHLLGLNNLIVPAKMYWDGREIDSYDTIDIDTLNRHFLNYINYGGYPEIVLSSNTHDDVSQYVRHDIVDKVMLRDLPSLYGIKDIQELNRLFVHIVYRSGEEFTYENLSQDSGIDKSTIKRYIQYFESAFLIKVVYKVTENAKKFQRITAFKIYLTNPSLRCALFSPLSASDSMFGHMVETAIYAQWIQRGNVEIHYARWKENKKDREVDMVGMNVATQKPSWAVEIKWSDRFIEQISELKPLLNFLENNKLSNTLVTTISKRFYKQMTSVGIQFIPASLYAYIVGDNTIKQRKMMIN
ncbi:MAG: ATP-binding protein [Bacteroidales bacterium]|nr:ATP-binding protein [Bacteroidales bacterium]